MSVISVYITIAKLCFRFTELDDELKDGCITLKVRVQFFSYILTIYVI